MTTIDQRILIPVESRVVWRHISNIDNNPGWQADCESVSFLTSIHNGPGTRWRYTTGSGREHVVEISAWYDGLGYEYTFVDGMPFRDNRGRIRLQEIAEGTVVQWTFTYQAGGMLGSLRDSLSVRKQIESTMVDSLRMLWRVIGEAGTAQQIREAKSLMRDAPDVESRAQYKPRHPSALHEEAQPGAQSPTPTSAIPEPPVSDEDTRPRMAVAAGAAPVREPDSPADSALFDKAPTESAPSVPETLPEFRQSSTTEILPAASVQGTPEAASSFQPSAASGQEISEDDELSELPAPGETITGKSSSVVDTGQISVFEVFGLPKPSETGELLAVNQTPRSDEPPPPTIVEPLRLAEDTQPTGATGRFMAIQRRPGLRQALRHESIKLRRP